MSAGAAAIADDDHAEKQPLVERARAAAQPPQLPGRDTPDTVAADDPALGAVMRSLVPTAYLPSFFQSLHDYVVDPSMPLYAR